MILCDVNKLECNEKSNRCFKFYVCISVTKNINL